VVGDHFPGSSWYGSRVPAGSVVTGVNGSRFGTDVDGVRRYFTDHPLGIGDVVEYRTPEGAVERAVLGPTFASTNASVPLAAADFAARFDLRLVGVRAVDATGFGFRPVLQIELAQQAEYRLVDAGGEPLADWIEYGSQSTVELIGRAIPRVAGDSYELFVERRRGGEVRRYQAAFKLTVPNP
jgi:hypothetical protein